MRALVFIFISCFGIQALANNSFIPNFYRNRQDLNHFAALGWSDRHQVELTYFTETTAQDSDGVRSTDSNNSGPELQAFYRLPNKLNFELDGAFYKTNSDFSGFSTARSAQRTETRGRIGTGYEFANIP